MRSISDRGGREEVGIADLLIAGELSDADWKNLNSARKKAKGQITGATRVPIRLLVNANGSNRKDLLRLFLQNRYQEKLLELKQTSIVGKYVADFQRRYSLQSVPGKYVTKLLSWSRRHRFVAIIWEIKTRPGATQIDFRADTK